MKSNKERIFLHFLDREASYLSKSISLPKEKFVKTFQICAFHSYEDLVLSGGHLFEHPAALEIYRKYPDLFLTGQVIPIAKAKSIEEFIYEKSTQYSHTKNSNHRDYSIYFNNNWEIIFQGQLNFERPMNDTTTFLAQEMKNSFSGNNESAKRIFDTIVNRGSRAITSQLFNEIRQELSSRFYEEIVFCISKNYQKIYRDQHGEKIFFGTGLINTYIEEINGSELSFEIARYFNINLNLRRIFRNPTFSFAEFRGSIEHIRYVDTIRTLLKKNQQFDQAKVSRVLARVLPQRFRGTSTDVDIELQCCAVSDALGQFHGADLEQIFTEVNIGLHSNLAVCNQTSSFLELEKMQKDETNYQNPRLFLVVAARNELQYAREFLKENGYDISSETTLADNKIGNIFYLKTYNFGVEKNLPVALVRANAKGKSEMRALVEAIDRYENPSIVIMVGMMAGILNKSHIFDVISPRPIYDATQISSKGNSLYVEPNPSYMDTVLHNRIGNMDWSETPERQIRILTDKVTATVPGTFDSLTNDIANQAITRDPENTIGLEMEASALSEKQRDQTQTGSTTRYLMIKGVADYAGDPIPGDEVKTLRKIDAIANLLPKKHVNSLNPRESDNMKAAFQREATYRSMSVALRLLSKFPDV